MKQRSDNRSRLGSVALTTLVTGALALTPAVASADTFIDAADPCLGTPEAAPFTDREQISPVHLPNVDCTFAAQIFEGSTTDDGREFLPDVNVSRGQMAAIMVRALEHAGYDLPASPADAFTDDNGTVFESEINTVAALEIAGGFGDGTFRPGEAISRAQMASFLVRAAEISFGSDFTAVTSNPYTDVPAGSPHLGAIITATDVIGLTSGSGDGKFNPGAPTTREQMASFVTRLVDLVLLDASEPASDPESGPLLTSEQRSL